MNAKDIKKIANSHWAKFSIKGKSFVVGGELKSITSPLKFREGVEMTSLLGKQNTEKTISTTNNIRVCTDNTFQDIYTGTPKYINSVSGNKYAIVWNATVDFSTKNRFFYTTSKSWASQTYNSGYHSGNISVSVFTIGTTEQLNLTTGGSVNGETLNYALIIDLTSLGLDNLTAQQFYEQYNHLFDKLANGETVNLPITYNLLKRVDLGSLNWYYGSDLNHENMFTAILSDIKTPIDNDTKANIVCDKYQNETYNNLYAHSKDNIIAIRSNGRIYIYSSTMGTNPTDFKNAMSGVYLYYETTNLIELRSAGNVCDELFNWNGKIMRRIGIVDLGSLTNWSKGTAYNHNEIRNTGLSTVIKATIGDTDKANILCAKYTTNARNLLANNEIGLNGLGTVIINDSELYSKTSAEIQQSLSGILLFYELATPTTEYVNSLMLPKKANICEDVNGVEVEVEEANITQLSMLLNELNRYN